jgi:hypothetical protein
VFDVDAIPNGLFEPSKCTTAICTITIAVITKGSK